MRLLSPAFLQGQSIPTIYTCKAKNISPPLQITDIPPTTKSVALVLHDPDAVSGDWVHWLVWNLQPKMAFIPEGSLPENAVEGTTSFGNTGYGGPCPPEDTGVHHYTFELFALNKLLELPKSTTREQLEEALEPHILAHTQLVGLYKVEG